MVNYDDDYLTEKNEEPSFSAGVGWINTSNAIISNCFMREMIWSLNFQLNKYLMRYVTGVKVN